MLAQSGKIIRVQKALRNGSNYDTGSSVVSKHECIVWKDDGAIVTSPNREIAEQLYVKCVMIPLLGSEFVDPGVCWSLTIVYGLCLCYLLGVFVTSVCLCPVCRLSFFPHCTVTNEMCLKYAIASRMHEC